ncbi:MAG: response regulator transcription factor [Bacteroidales bacterium]|nr:response regulator transcription factor [Bacteroidales bacterium]
MTTISCIIIDDEPLAVQLMESYVGKTPFLELKGSFTSGTAAFNFIQENPVDLMFCDIQMPNLSGMELSKMIPEETRVIFTTAFSQYAIEGFKVHALDYLMKPISYDDFLAAAKHALKVISTAQRAGAANESGSNEGPAGNAEDVQVRSIFVKTEYRLQQIELNNITFIEGFKDYVRIHLADGSDPVLTLVRMKALEDQLPGDRFVRVQKSYIVQLSKIDAIERSRIIIGNDRIPIGEAYQENLFKILEGGSILPK